MKKLLTFLTLLTLFFTTGWAAEGDQHDMGITQSTLLNNNASIPSVNIAEQSYPIKAVTVRWRHNKDNEGVTIEVKVNGTSWGTQTVTNSGSNYYDAVFEGTSTTGAVEITFTNNTGSGTGHGTFYVSNVILTEGASGSSTNTCAKPSISINPASGPYYVGDEVTATIDCETDGASILYSLDNGTTWNPYSSAVTIPSATAGTVTIKAKATKTDYNDSGEATASVTFVEPPTQYTSLADVNGLADNTVFTYGAQTVVLGADGKNMYIVMPDNSAGTLVYANSDWSSDYTFGKVINSGWGGTKATYSTKPEVKNPTNFSLSGTTTDVTPITITSSDLTKANFGRYAVLKNVAVDASGNIDGITIYKQFGDVFNGSAAGVYDVYGVIGWHSNAGQFLPLRYEAVTVSGSDFYLAGTFNSWNGQDDNYKFTNLGNGTYTLSGKDLPDDVEFQIVKDGATWYGGQVGDPQNEQTYGINGSWHTTIPMTESYNNSSVKNYKMQVGGISNITINTSTMQFAVEKETPQFYIKCSDDWTNKISMTATNDGGWTITKELAANTQFGFDDEWNWYGGNGWWIREEHLGQELDLDSNNPFKMIDAGTYTITVNQAKTKVVVTKVTVPTGDIYTLVESADDLVAGDNYIIVARSGSATYSGTTYNYEPYVLVPTTGVNVQPAQNGVTLSSDYKTATITTESNVALTLEGSNGAWKFNSSVGYLFLASDANNLSVGAPSTASNAETSIAIDGAASIVFNNNPLHNNNIRSLKFNPNAQSTGLNPRFACYTGTSMKDVYLYKKGASNTSVAPTITPESGNIVGFSQEVTMTQSNGGTIYYTYTTDGIEPADPTTESDTYDSQNKFWAEVDNLGQEVWIKAVAKEGNKDLSSVVSVKYRFIAPKNPVFDPKAGTFSTPQSVSITTATEGAKVYYTTNANLSAAEIATQGTEFTEPIIVTETTTLYAVSVYYDAHTERNAVSSNKVTAKYTIVGEDDVVPVYSIAEFNTLETGLKARFMNPVTVLYDYSQRSYSSQLGVTTYQEYIWVKDETGFTQIYLRPSLNSNNTETKQIAFYENGDVIPAGFIVDKQYYETGQYVQAYSERAGEDPTQPGNNVTAGFLVSTQKALADPEPFTAAQLATLPTDDLDTYNNRYISISKVKITSNTVSSNKQFRIAGDGVTINNVVGYHKYSDATSYLKDGETQVTEVITVPPVSETTYYNVKAILQVWQNGWEIMPIEFTEWEAKTVTLRELCDKGVTTEGQNVYTISNPLQVVYVDTERKSVWVKDDTGQSIWKTAPESPNSENFEIEYADNTRSEQANYDQSNWCQLVFASADDIPSSFANTPIINGGKIYGKFTNKLNPTLENVTFVGENELILSASSSYDPNYYVAANFVGPQKGYFFMNPKPQEYAHVVWAYYDSETNTMNMSNLSNQNPNGFEGSFKIDMSMNSDPTIELVDFDDTGKGYENFQVIVRLKTSSKGVPTGSEYEVFPLDITNVVTSINEVLAGNGEVKSVKFYNVAGIESNVPFQGVNIVVTEYTDGSRTTTKMLKR